jgi:hypothetical protein
MNRPPGNVRPVGSVWQGGRVLPFFTQCMDVAGIAQVAFTGGEHVRDVIHSVNADGFGYLRPGQPNSQLKG